MSVNISATTGIIMEIRVRVDTKGEYPRENRALEIRYPVVSDEHKESGRSRAIGSCKENFLDVKFTSTS